MTEFEKATKALAAPGQKGDEAKKAGAAKGKAGGPPGGFEMTPEMQKQQKEFQDNFKKATPAKRKEMLQQLPEAIRDFAKQRFKAEGLEIAE